MKTGVFLARMQPLHNAHLLMVNNALQECDKVIVILGSANKKDMIRNPYSLSFRSELLHAALLEEHGQQKMAEKKVEVYELPDWSMESDNEGKHIWGEYLYYNIVSRAKTKQFTFFYGDDPEIMLSWFRHREDLMNNLGFKFFERSTCLKGLSATKIRNAILSGDKRYVTEFCPPVVVRNFEKLQSIWKEVLNDPLEDFSME